MPLPEQTAYELPLEPDGSLPELYVGIAGRAILRVAFKTRYEGGLADIPPEALQRDLDHAIEIVAASGDRSEVAVWTRLPETAVLDSLPGTGLVPDEPVPREYLGGQLRIDEGTGVVMVDGVKTTITERQLGMLELLTRHVGRVVTYAELAVACRNPRWPDILPSVYRVQRFADSIRKNVLGETLGRHIVMIKGLGFRFEEDEAYLD